jgi:hypothetical protein
MSDLRATKKGARDWRAALTTEERAELRPIEAEMKKLRERLAWLSFQFGRIQNRASVRAGRSS